MKYIIVNQHKDENCLFDPPFPVSYNDDVEYLEQIERLPTNYMMEYITMAASSEYEESTTLDILGAIMCKYASWFRGIQGVNP